MSILFVSDLHLDAKRPDIAGHFLHFLEHSAPAADALYILGDLFESWIGDDDPQPDKTKLANAIKKLSSGGIPCYFMHGNRDFMIGKEFAESAGLLLLEEEALINIHDEPVLLMHGDSLCTDDHEYQAMRKMTRDKQWQAQMLALPVEQRIAMAGEARQRSMAYSEQTADDIMDVNQEAVTAAMRKHNVTMLLHGHTHRPDVHHFDLDGAPATRIVLGDWYEQGSIVSWDHNGPRLESLPR